MPQMSGFDRSRRYSFARPAPKDNCNWAGCAVIFAALAQEERRLISERTRNALAEAKKRGVQLGKNGKVLAERNRRAADERAEALRPIIMPMVEQGLSLGEIASRLNEMGLRTATLRRFYPQQARAIIARLTSD